MGVGRRRQESISPPLLAPRSSHLWGRGSLHCGLLRLPEEGEFVIGGGDRYQTAGDTLPVTLPSGSERLPPCPLITAVQGGQVIPSPRHPSGSL